MKPTAIAAAAVLVALAIPAPALAASDSQIWTNGSVTVKLSDHLRLQ